MSQTKKMSQSYEKPGECVAELPCEHEFPTKVAFRSKEVSDYKTETYLKGNLK